MSFKPKYSISYLETWDHDDNAHDLPEELKRAYQEIEKLTEALEFYANNWTLVCASPVIGPDLPPGSYNMDAIDNGQRAREALGESKEPDLHDAIAATTYSLRDKKPDKD